MRETTTFWYYVAHMLQHIRQHHRYIRSARYPTTRLILNNLVPSRTGLERRHRERSRACHASPKHVRVCTTTWQVFTSHALCRADYSAAHEEEEK
eukprot:scaffold1197_cov228-Pinguiococcus_pyrenoidosus.AAC.6